MNLAEILAGIFSRCTLGIHDWKRVKGWDDPHDESGHTRTDRDVCQRCYAFRYVPKASAN
jgi:hypothetical protein